jgi:hypothetical protein
MGLCKLSLSPARGWLLVSEGGEGPWVGPGVLILASSQSLDELVLS